jgi:hypothetical protein
MGSRISFLEKSSNRKNNNDKETDQIVTSTISNCNVIRCPSESIHIPKQFEVSDQILILPKISSDVFEFHPEQSNETNFIYLVDSIN